ncbi:hypothetical protein BV898_08795 [Hypsibius exemplaris]|uniref:Uncharacterized protein n=1 Tax=Hypsibius exemplaris TaxID=2072580 RepID=A0A1W0WPE4_HYPEX|nr:hypothetical protein BV898_08795 [Hypsibius exemplaris]
MPACQPCSLRIGCFTVAGTFMVLGVLGSLASRSWRTMIEYQQEVEFYNYATVSVILFMSGCLLFQGLLKSNVTVLRVWFVVNTLALLYEITLFILAIFRWTNLEPAQNFKNRASYETVSWTFKLPIILFCFLIPVVIICLCAVRNYRNDLIHTQLNAQNYRKSRLRLVDLLKKQPENQPNESTVSERD